MRELPKGWEKTELKSLITISSGKGLTQKNMIEGDVPVFGGNGITGWHNLGNVCRPTIVIGRVGYYCGSVYITPDTAWVTDNAFVTSFEENLIDINFLYWLLIFTDLRQNDSSSAQPVISGQKVYPIKVKLPPLAEQKRIVEKLDEVLAQVDTIKARLDGIPAILKRFRQSVLASAVSGKLTEKWLGSKALNWPLSPLKALTSKIGSGSTPRGGQTAYKAEGIPLVRSMNIHSTYIKYDGLAFIDDAQAEKLNNAKIELNDVLLNITGASIGRVNLAPAAFIGGRVNQHVAIIRCDSEKLLPRYLQVLIASPSKQKWILGENYGATRQALTKGMIEEIAVNLPKIEEQKEIVRLVDNYFELADTIEAQVKKAQARVDNLTQSILAKAFRGELVPQDPNDEPADKLLERIAQARLDAETLAKAAKKATSSKKSSAK